MTVNHFNYQPMIAVLEIDFGMVLAVLLMPAVVAGWGAGPVGRWTWRRRQHAASSNAEAARPEPQWPTYEPDRVMSPGVNLDGKQAVAGWAPLGLGVAALAVSVAGALLAWSAVAVVRPPVPPTAPAQTAESPAAARPRVKQRPGEAVGLVAAGFGQIDEYAQGIAIVEVREASAIGEFVTVSMNFLDAKGDILATEEQVETADWTGQQIALPLSTEVSNGQVVSVDTSVSLSSYSDGEPPRESLAPIVSKEILTDDSGSPVAVFKVVNDTDQDLADLRLGIACFDANGVIIGGTSEYPALLEAGKTIRVDASVIASGVPASCTAFPGF